MIRLFARRMSAYEIGGYWWVVIEPLAISDDRTMRWKWSIRPITLRTPSGIPVPSSLIAKAGYSYTKADARGAAHQAALALSD